MSKTPLDFEPQSGSFAMPTGTILAPNICPHPLSNGNGTSNQLSSATVSTVELWPLRTTTADNELNMPKTPQEFEIHSGTFAMSMGPITHFEIDKKNMIFDFPLTVRSLEYLSCPHPKSNGSAVCNQYSYANISTVELRLFRDIIAQHFVREEELNMSKTSENFEPQSGYFVLYIGTITARNICQHPVANSYGIWNSISSQTIENTS